MSQTQANVIYDLREFLKIPENPDEDYVLGADIDLSLLPTMQPLGVVDETAFTGTLDGAGYTIKNATLNMADGTTRTGLFWETDGATIKNVTLENFIAQSGAKTGAITPVATGGITLDNVTSTIIKDSSGDVLSGAVGELDGDLEAVDCDFQVAGYATTLTAGAVAKQFTGSATIENCTTNVVTEGEVENVAGYIGRVDLSDVTVTADDSEASVVSNGQTDYAAGAVGNFSGSTITSDGFTGNVEAGNSIQVGGVVGLSDTDSDSVTVTDFDVEVTQSGSTTNLGGAVGRAVCNVTATTGTASVTKDGGATYLGGVVGILQSTSSSLDVADTDTQVEYDPGGSNPGPVSSGGIAGQAEINTLSVTNCTANFTSVSMYTQAGGIIGNNLGELSSADDAVIESCDTNVDFEGGNSGGIVGSRQGSQGENLVIRDCTAQGEIKDPEGGSTYGMGGLAGRAPTTEIESCVADVDVQAAGLCGGLVGTLGGPCTDSTATGDVTATGDYGAAGGVVAEAEGPISGCASSGKVIGGGNVGGIVADTNADVSDCVTTSDVEASGTTAGGIVAVTDGGSISESASYGDVSGGTTTGGILGLSYLDGSVTECAHIGSVKATGTNSGGLFGDLSDHTANNCYHSGEIHGDGDIFVRPVAGSATNYGDISNCYVKAHLSGDATMGLADNTDLNNPFGPGVYWCAPDRAVDDRDTSNPSNATRLTEDEITGQVTEDNMAELDFEAVWNWTLETPALQWQTPELATVSGTITDAVGDPVEDDLIAFGDQVYETDENGEYEVTLEGGESYEVTALSGFLTDAIYTSNDREVSYQYSGIIVEVRHPITDEPIENAPVRIEDDAMVLTDEDGMAELKKLPGGEYSLSVLGVWSETLTLDDEGDTHNILFDGGDLEVTADVEVRSVETGNPLDEIGVTLPRTDAETYTGPDGTATLVAEGIATATRIRVAAEDPRYETQSIEVSEDTDHVETTVQLPERVPRRQ